MAAGDGRLTPDELDERLEVALAARTWGELAALTADLPAVPGVAAVPGVPGVRPKEFVRIDIRSGHTTRDGRWMVPQRIEVQVTSGWVTLDFTEAIIAQPALQIDAQVGSGKLRLITKPGIVVDVDDVAVRSGRAKVLAPWGHDVPVTLRIDVSGQVGSGRLTARPPRRTLGQWLLRRPKPYAPPSR